MTFHDDDALQTLREQIGPEGWILRATQATDGMIAGEIVVRRQWPYLHILHCDPLSWGELVAAASRAYPDLGLDVHFQSLLYGII